MSTSFCTGVWEDLDVVPSRGCKASVTEQVESTGAAISPECSIVTVDSSQYGKSVEETSTPMVASELGGVKLSSAKGGSTAEDSTVISAS